MKYLVAILALVALTATAADQKDKGGKQSLEMRVAWLEGQLKQAHVAFNTMAEAINAEEDQITELQEHVQALEGQHVVRAVSPDAGANQCIGMDANGVHVVPCPTPGVNVQ